jgi:hypothetical protein
MTSSTDFIVSGWLRAGENVRYNYHTVLRCVSKDPVDTCLEVNGDFSRRSVFRNIIDSQMYVDDIGLVVRDIFERLSHAVFEGFETPSVDNFDIIGLRKVAIVKRPHDGVSNEDSFARSGPTAV